MKWNWIKGCVAAIAMTATTFADFSHASLTTAGCLNEDQFCTLEELAGGASLVVNGRLFSNWSASDASSIGVNLSRIEIHPLDDQPAGAAVRYRTNGELTTAGLDEIDLDLFFTVSALATASRFDTSSLVLDDVAFGSTNQGGFVRVSQDLWSASGIDWLGGQDVLATFAGPSNVHDILSLTPPESVLSVTTHFLITGDGAIDEVSLNGFTQRFSEAPEPASLALVGLALSACWSAARRWPTARRP